MIATIKMNKDIATLAEIHHFRNILFAFILAVATEILWALDRGGYITITGMPSWIYNGIAIVSISWLLYEWFRFVASRVLRIEKDELAHSAVRIQTIIVALDIILTFSSYVTGAVYSIDAQSIYHRGPLYGVHTIFCYSHWICASLLLLRGQRKTARLVRGQMRNLLLLSIFPVIGGALQLVNYNVPFLDGSIILGLLMMFMDAQKEQITTDALTGLNNRGSFVRGYERMLLNADAVPFILFVADLNGFKAVNDTYGHLVGDQTLLAVADALRRIGKEYPSLGVYRYGGDEFTLLIAQRDVKDPETFGKVINEMLREEETKANLPVQVEFGIGYEIIDSTQTDANDAFKRADQMLYNNKRRAKTARG